MFQNLGEIRMIGGIKRVALIATMAMVGSTANAALSVDLSNAVGGAADMYAAGQNDILGDAQGYFGANIYVDSGTTLNFEYLGAESFIKTKFEVENNNGDKDKFVNKGKPFFLWNTAPQAQNNQPFSMTFLDGGLLDFSFTAKAPFIFWDPKNKVDNGSNGQVEHLPAPDFLQKIFPITWFGAEPAFWTGIEYSSDNSSDISALYLGFNHGYGWVKDFDDMVVKISIAEPTPVPVPAALPLYSAALVLVAWLRRKKLAA